MKLSTRARDFLKGYERGGKMVGGKLVLLPPSEPALETYIDDVGVLTIAWGHTGKVRGQRLVMGMKITRQEAEDLLSEDLREAEDTVNNGTRGHPTNQNQFDAMVLFAFNAGCAGYRGSHLLQYHNAGKYDAAAAQFGRWNKGTINGKKVELRGLTRRRGEEAEIYLRPSLADRKVITPELSHTISDPELSQRITPDTPVKITKTPAVIGAATTALAVTPIAATSVDHAVAPKSTDWLHLHDHAFVWIAGGLTVVVLLLVAYIIWRRVADYRKGIK